MTQLEELTAISPLDGRYRTKLHPLASYFSEYALIRYRVKVEIEYLIALLNHKITLLHPVNTDQIARLRQIYQDFDIKDARKVKNIESQTNHDVKAVEYFIKERMMADGDQQLSSSRELVHFALTSQDINNTAIPLMIRDAIQDVCLTQLKVLTDHLLELGDEWKEIPMLARTHGQPASPTTVGKEIIVFAKRLMLQLTELEEIPYPAKFGGATGNMNAHYIAYPDIDWDGFADEFVEERLGLVRSFPTTQIDHYDGLSRIFDCLCRINSIIIDLCQDMWIYISMDYFGQKTQEHEVGSSTMPHKVNPIDFENAEGNSGFSTAILQFLSRKLPISRLQRDLTDSTLLRNIGVGIGHAYLAYLSLMKGLNKLTLNVEIIEKDLDQNWSVLAEAIQTILRREGYENPYEKLKALTRGKGKISKTDLKSFIDELDVSQEIKQELHALSPHTYTGNAGR